MAEIYQCMKIEELATMRADLKNINIEVNHLKKVYDILTSQSENIAVMTTNFTNLKDDVATIRNDVKELKEVPAKDYQHYKRAMLTNLLLLVIGLLFGLVVKGVI